MQVDETTRAQAAARRAVGIWERLDAPDAPDYATVLALYAGLQEQPGGRRSGARILREGDGDSSQGVGCSIPDTPIARPDWRWLSPTWESGGPRLTTAVNAEATGRAHLRTMLRSLPERSRSIMPRCAPAG